VGLCLAAGSASAQVSAPLGLKVGDGRLHPFLDVVGRYDSLVGYFSNVGATAVPSGDIIIDPRAGLRFELTNDQTTVSLFGQAEYLIYTGAISPGAVGLSHFQANLNLETAFNKNGPLEIQLGDTLSRSDRTQNPAVGVGVMSLYNDLHLAMPIHPGGGALEFTPRVGWSVEFFDPLATGTVTGCSGTDSSCNPALVGQMNYSNLNFGLGGRWKFFPKTALVLDSGFSLRTYWNSTAGSAPADLLNVRAGLSGLISARVTVTLLAGVAKDFANSALLTPIGQAEVSYIPTDLSSVAVGYSRTANPVPLYGTYVDDRGYLQGHVGFMGGRLSLMAQVALDAYTFSKTSATSTARSDLSVTGTLGPQFDILSWLQVGASYALGYRTSSDSVSTVNFVRHEVSARLTFHY
jgi:hypothetical protein